MIIVSLTLTHVGPFTRTVVVGPLSPGLNVLSAYNEEGKSTLVRATARALFDRHTCKSDEIKQIQPIGTALSPKIRVEFIRAGTQYRIEKEFLESEKSRLSTLSDGAWKLLAEGDAADIQLRLILNSSFPGRGATKPEHWGLFQYLWARQGEPSAWPNWSGDAGNLVRARLVRIQLDPVTERMLNVFEEDYAEIFTDTGRAKTRGPLDAAERELSAYQTELQSLRTRVQEIDNAETQYQQVTERVSALETEANEKNLLAEELSQVAREAERLTADLRLKERDLDIAREKLHTVDGDISTLLRLRQTKIEAQASLQTEKESNGRFETEITNLERDYLDAGKAIDQEGKAREALQHALDDVQDLLKYRRLKDQAIDLASRLGSAEQEERELKGIGLQRDKLPALTERKLKSLQELNGEIDKISAQLEAIGVAIELTPASAQQVRIQEASQARTVAINPGKTELIRSGQSVELQLKSWGRITVRSGATELVDLLKNRDVKTKSLKSSFSDLGAYSIDDVAAMLERKKDLDNQFRLAERDLKNILGDHEDIHSLRAEVARQKTELGRLEKGAISDGKDRQGSVTDLEAESERLRIEGKQADARIKEARDEAKRFQDDLGSLREKHRASATNQAIFQERLDNAKSRIQQIESSYTQGLEADKKNAQTKFAEAEARYITVQAKLPPDAEKLPERNRRAARAAQEAKEALQALLAERDKLTGRLHTLGAQGVFSRETELLEAIAVKQLEVDAVRRRGWALRMLHDLIERRRQAATYSVLAPLQQQLSSTFADLTGNRAREVFLDKDLEIRGIGVSESEAIPFEVLSQGAKEQLLLALRLAVARATAEDERQLLILDDVLVNTDPIRQERVLDLLQSAAEHLQLLVLTCHADRYRGIGQALKIEPQSASDA